MKDEVFLSSPVQLQIAQTGPVIEVCAYTYMASAAATLSTSHIDHIAVVISTEVSIAFSLAVDTSKTALLDFKDRRTCLI